MPASLTAASSGLRRRHVWRRLGLVSASARVMRQGFAARAGRLYGWSIAILYGGLLAHRAYAGDPDGSVMTFRFALSSLSFAAGLVAWGTARDLASEERAEGLPMLAGRLGFSPGEQRLARVVAAMIVVGLSVVLPGGLAAVFGLGFAPDGRAIRMGVLLVGAVVAYGAAFGLVMGGLARWASSVSPRHGRGLFALILLGPAVLGTGVDVIQGLRWLIDRVAGLAAGAA